MENGIEEAEFPPVDDLSAPSDLEDPFAEYPNRGVDEAIELEATSTGEEGSV